MDNNIIQHFANQFQVMQNNIKRQSGYLARQEINTLLNDIKKDATRLEPFGFKVYSQNDEDGIIEEIFKRLNSPNFANTSTLNNQNLNFVEIGVENGLECNSLYLLHKGWKGLWLEGNTRQQKPIEQKFNSLLRSQKLKLGIGIITPNNINQVLQQAAINTQNLDFLSIDIDGNDIYLLDAIEFSPKVICIEYNAKFPSLLNKKPVFNPQNFWKGTDFMGSSLLAISEVAKQKNYVLVATNITAANAFYVRKDLINQNFYKPDDDFYQRIKTLYNPPRYWLTFDHFNNIGHPADFGDYADLQN